MHLKLKLNGATAREGQDLLCEFQYTCPLGAEVDGQIFRSGGQSEARPLLFKSPSKLGTYLSTPAAGRRAVLLARWIVRSVPLEIVGSSEHEKLPTRRKPVLERPGKPRRERGSKDRTASTCRPHSDSFNDMSRRRRSNCSTNNFLTPCRSKS
ncbi:hypothetical protein TNCV_3775551 [Trichonephila clavipes]|nr:hypothetical protein TNCV_3775551 [Trichonephila clavipes]